MLPSHQLGPEELTVEAQALRALGRDDQAKDVDSTLRKRFPESALAR
jgi:TolA-binding protein